MARIETATQRNRRLEKARQKYRQKRENENNEERAVRLDRKRFCQAQVRANERQEESTKTLLVRESENLVLHSNHTEIFEKSVSTFADRICEICRKQCYANQVSNVAISQHACTYLSEELCTKGRVISCSRCANHLKSKKSTYPSKAFWNNLDPGPIPEEILNLTQPEQRLLARIIPFVKVIKYNGLFGQYGFKGQAVLFAQDIFEVTEKIPTMLPRSSAEAGIVVFTERLENLNVMREYCIRREKVFKALQWLIKNNPLYRDVIVDNDVYMDEQDFIRFNEEVQSINHQNNYNYDNNNYDNNTGSSYMPINEMSRILRASWHQGNKEVFTSSYAGIQCCAMVIANIIRSTIFPPQSWTMNTLNLNMIEGDKLYATVRALSSFIPESGYLLISDFNVIPNIHIFDRVFSLEYNADTNLFGNVIDAFNTNTLGKKLLDSLRELFSIYNAGILAAAAKTYGVMNIDNKFYFSDSHSCGPKGASAAKGKACVIQCDTIEELNRICKRATGSRNEQYTINFVKVHIKESNNLEEVKPAEEQSPMCQSLVQNIAVKTSVMLPIDSIQPDVEQELKISGNEILRKTKNNIVNDSHELKAEEYAWYTLFPFGKNGFKEERRIKITPLDYFQSRILGDDSRFQRNDYLFYALSMMEKYRVKSAISACGKKIQGQNGMIEDIHLYLKNLRGSAAYWRTALNELLAQIRCIGPPTYFITFSCNDLNWLDMRKALLIADGRPNEDPTTLDVHATQILIERYPVTVSRHFMIRVNAIMKYIKGNVKLFGGMVIDHWWRIEFQNRGSPHLHLVVWIENYPPFDSPEGIKVIDEIITCEVPPESSELYNLVMKCQIHRHTDTCNKNGTHCRFSFPRQECAETKIVAHSSEDFIRSGGRICILKRNAASKWVNNYNKELLLLWKGNMDIQPCGTNEAIAFYIAKYLSKIEPTELNPSITEAIKQIQREESDISRKVFKIVMRILNERQVSACESAFRLCHLRLRDSSRKCIFVNTRKPEQRYRMLKFDENDRAAGFYSNIIDRYVKRPTEHEQFNFNTMSLLEFAMFFEPYYAKKPEEIEENIDQDAYESHQQPRRQFITLTDNTKMIIRSYPAVVRTPFFKAAAEPDNYYYSLLLQYKPFREESELLSGYNSTKEAFLGNEEQLKVISERMELHRARDKQLEIAFNQVHAFEILDNPEPLEFEDVLEEVEEHMMNDTTFLSACRAMNADQRQLFNIITSNIQEQMKGNTSSLKYFITGGAGTGKTFLFNLLKNQINRCYGKKAVNVCALTGVAARLVGGSTLHSTLKLPVQKDGKIVNMPLLTGNFLQVMRNQWKDVEFFIVDEISMVPYEMLCQIDSRLKQLKNSEQFFGGINVLLFGDLLQLPPVRGHQIFQQPDRMAPASHLWQLFSLVELKQNMRQQGDSVFKDVLNALRIGEMKPEHFSILLQKLSDHTEGQFAIDKALRIYPTNKQVEDHNQRVLDHFRSMNTEIFKIRAQDQLIDAARNTENVNLENVIPTDVNKTGGFPKELEIFIGAKVMLRSNIDVSKGLVNGAIGYIAEIVWPHFRRAQIYTTDIPSVRVDFGKDGVHIIQPKTTQFPAKYSYGTAERRMLPLILSWASTVHKMQGSTVDYAVVHLGKALFAEGQAYVALSRVRSLDGLLIEELDCDKLTGKKPCNNNALIEIERMRSMQCG